MDNTEQSTNIEYVGFKVFLEDSLSAICDTKEEAETQARMLKAPFLACMLNMPDIRIKGYTSYDDLFGENDFSNEEVYQSIKYKVDQMSDGSENLLSRLSELQSRSEDESEVITCAYSLLASIETASRVLSSILGQSIDAEGDFKTAKDISGLLLTGLQSFKFTN